MRLVTENFATQPDRLVLAKNQMARRLRDRRASSKLLGLVELVLARPLVSTGMIQERLKVSKQGALNLIGELSLARDDGQGAVSRVGDHVGGFCRKRNGKAFHDGMASLRRGFDLAVLSSNATKPAYPAAMRIA